MKCDIARRWPTDTLFKSSGKETLETYAIDRDVMNLHCVFHQRSEFTYASGSEDYGAIFTEKELTEEGDYTLHLPWTVVVVNFNTGEVVSMKSGEVTMKPRKGWVPGSGISPPLGPMASP